MEQLTREILKEELKAFKEAVDTSMDDKLRIQTDLLRQEIKASEFRTDKKIEALGQNLETKMDAMENRILQGVSDTIEEHVYPKLDDHEKRITKLETKTA